MVLNVKELGMRALTPITPTQKYPNIYPDQPKPITYSIGAVTDEGNIKEPIQTATEIVTADDH